METFDPKEKQAEEQFEQETPLGEQLDENDIDSSLDPNGDGVEDEEVEDGDVPGTGEDDDDYSDEDDDYDPEDEDDDNEWGEDDDDDDDDLPL